MRASRAQAFNPGLTEPAPFINTTPLIDLMLVLLVMFIVSIPIATRKLPLDVPRGEPAAPHPFHRLELDAGGRLFWDGRPIEDRGLGGRLARMAADPSQAELHIAAHAETRYDRVNQILAVVRRSGITRLGFVGNERFVDAPGQ